MPTVKVRRTRITAEQAAEVIRRSLGDGYQVEPSAPAELKVRRGTFTRARVRIRQEPGGTVFDVRGEGLPIPLLIFTVKLANDRGVARRTADLIGGSEAFRDDS